MRKHKHVVFLLVPEIPTATRKTQLGGSQGIREFATLAICVELGCTNLPVVVVHASYE